MPPERNRVHVCIRHSTSSTHSRRMPLFDNRESVAEPDTYCEYNLGDIEWDNGFNLARPAIEYQENYSRVCICHDAENWYQDTKVDPYVGHAGGEGCFLKIPEVLSERYPISNESKQWRDCVVNSRCTRICVRERHAAASEGNQSIPLKPPGIPAPVQPVENASIIIQ